MSSYPYKALDLPRETRVLTVFPGDSADDIVCSMSHMDIESSGEFDALSYCWSRSIANPPDTDLDQDTMVLNNPPRTITFRESVHEPDYAYIYYRYGGSTPETKIHCDGTEMMIGGELYLALTALRSKLEPLRIWVDAVCINQTDIQERNEHVKMMGKIYAAASVVRVWLGPAIGVEQKAHQAFVDVTSLFRDLEERIAPFHPETVGAATKLLVQRIWVVQEIAMAKKAVVYSGLYKIGWNYLESMVSTIRRYNIDALVRNTTATKAIAVMGLLREYRHLPQVGDNPNIPYRMEILSALEELRAFKSTLASDKLYGILGLSVIDEDKVDVDYNKTPEEIFTSFAISHLRTGSLDILTHCVESMQQTTGPGGRMKLPSWVPDWTRPGWVEPFRVRLPEFKAAGGTRTQSCFQIDEAAGILGVTGRILDRIKAVNEKMIIPLEASEDTLLLATTNPDLAKDPEARNKARLAKDAEIAKKSMENIINIAWQDDVTKKRVCNRKQFESMWRTFMCNRTRDKKVPESYYALGFLDLLGFQYPSFIQELKESLQRCDDCGTCHRPVLVLPESRTPADIATDFRAAHSQWCPNRRFFVSEAGRYGWAVDGAVCGDTIVVFYGCDYPFILRETKVTGGQGAGHYQIIGDSYIHRLMEGEGITDGFEERDFLLA